ncbi:MAG: DnaJ domain-containing protein [Planctomycetota bacterium]
MQNKEFVDYFEVLEISPNASRQTIDRIFRHLAKKYHPDTTGSADNKKFAQLVEAYETLCDPERRASYDTEYNRQQARKADLMEEAGYADKDTEDRHKLLSLFYAQRRKDMRNPGIGIATLEHMMRLPTDVLDFHLWYFRENGWIQREEAGPLSITAAGVDKIEKNIKEFEGERLKRITTDFQPHSVDARGNGHPDDGPALVRPQSAV